ncbi:hypothetical protein [Streptomyces parvus]|uniref:hypothetical protein n=1 Tax=Streptomyces parvus TaxID=66428 RepID=UPI0033CE9721
MSDGLPSRQTVNAVGGRLRAREIAVGTRLWTLHGHRAVQTTVTDVTAVKVRTAVEVATCPPTSPTPCASTPVATRTT